MLDKYIYLVLVFDGVMSLAVNEIYSIVRRVVYYTGREVRNRRRNGWAVHVQIGIEGIDEAAR